MSLRSDASRLRFRKYLHNVRSGDRRVPGVARARHRDARSHARTRSFGTLFVKFYHLLRGQRRAVLFALVTVTISTLLMLLTPIALKLTIDNVLGDKPLPGPLQGAMTLGDNPRQLLTIIAVSLIVIALAAGSIRLWGRWHATRATKRMQANIRRDVFDHAVRLPLHRVYQLKSGGVASILREDAGSVAELIFGMIYNPWRAIIQLIGAMIMLAVTDWKLLIGSLILIPTVYVTHRTWINRIRPFYRDIRQSRQDVDSMATEAFGGMRVVRAFGRQRSESGRFIRSNNLMMRQELNVWWWARMIETIWEVLIPIASAALLWYGGLRVLAGALTIGDLAMFLGYLSLLLSPLATLAASAAQFQNSLAGLDRVLDLLDEPREMQASPNAITLQPPAVAGQITFNSVSFGYPKSHEMVLQDIDLNVEAGRMIALVGPSGAGKTTLCNLVARFYDPTEGTIKLDGRDLPDIEVESYRRLLGIVEQDIFLFDGTIGENIGYANRNATQDQIQYAAEIANAHDFISRFENGYQTLIGERGVRLSGGQRQRLAIARAVLADPRILILDEATSNLDTESERLIQQSLATLMRGRTSFVIAHRLSTIINADTIAVLEHGHIIETGTHNELMAISGRYRRMVRLQTGEAMQSNQHLADDSIQQPRLNY